MDRSDDNRSLLHSIFRSLTKILAGIAGISFIFGRGIISVAGNTDRGTGEFLGIGIALALGLLAPVRPCGCRTL